MDARTAAPASCASAVPARGLPPRGAAVGLHCTADLQGCAAGEAMTDPQALRALCLQAVVACGLHPVGELFHAFAGGGVTGVLLLAESHLAVHTWPEWQAATLDVYVCNVGQDNRAAAVAVLDHLSAALGAQRSRRQALERPLGPGADA